ncbi:hypothetical protein [Kitasatospora griseola]|uniref:hypothetical protein n=1 Tax=Kitasatospora griseola TaxID=2064 RepID=UPI0013792BBD|nr:hypothetical protein [Kitasatospora griseola]
MSTPATAWPVTAASTTPASAAAPARTATSASPCHNARSGEIPRSAHSRSRSNDQAVSHPTTGRTSKQSSCAPPRQRQLR